MCLLTPIMLLFVLGKGMPSLRSVGAQEQLKLEVSNEPDPVVMLDLG